MKMRSTAATNALVLGAALLVTAASSHAQNNHQRSSNEPAAEADLPFREGVRLRKAGQVTEACDRFEASQRLDPARGTLLNLANCREQLGQTATAWKAYSKLLGEAELVGDGKRALVARRAIRRLDGELSRVLIELPAGTTASELAVAVDGQPWPGEKLGVAVLLDPGTHELRVESAGAASWTKQFELPASTTLRLQIPAPTPEPRAPGLVAARVSQPAQSPLPPRVDDSSPGLGTYSLLGLGLVGLGAGAWFGMQASGEWRDAESEGGPDRCSDEANDYTDDAKRSASISNISFGVGVTAVLVGGYLWYRAGSEQTKPSSQVGVQLPRSRGAVVTFSMIF